MTAVIALCGCSRSSITPRPYGYVRLALPEQHYHLYDKAEMPFRFDLSDAAEVQKCQNANEKNADGLWFDIVYPSLDARINCTYRPVKGNLRELSADAAEFVYKHATLASSIPEQGFENPEKGMYGVFYSIRGNTASPYQFYMTDSTTHFLRGAVYFNCVPNQDSLAPAFSFMEADLRHLIETLEWK